MIYRIIKPVIQAIGQMALITLAIVWLLDSGAQAMGYQWQWHRVPDYIVFYDEGEWWPAELIEGLIVTIKISAISLVFTLIIGLTTALLRLSDSIMGRVIATCYIELIRNTPLLVQIYLLYFVFGPVIGLDRFSTAVLALSLFQGAYTAEILRAGLNGVPKGQFEAAKTLGLSSYSTYKDVILPQVIQRTLPPLTNEVVSLIKNSSIVSVMAIFDLTTEARNIVSETAMPFEIWFSVAAIYLVLTLSLSGLSAWLESRLGASWRKI
ncbi:amino acid ABC transporter permease [Vibrio renipiscarius]|uniref:Putative glutamine transport system permease protein GlnP n=1 Tax=Vibrio renipiscarius TaxID=1461322 RepID=A0A0C2JSD7_9VIBR|nr:amino acid ABC transporter permease [Vibrio renipiscarius]KII79417.1 polar amino acid ABC transporter permease [Vibrio renipiscarius]KII80954.1 polar amino acid ABC transporter permease [Vibrio renipiscarius]